MERDEIRTQIRSIVDDLFSEKEESAIRKKTEATLEKSAKTISDLTSTLEDKTTECAEFESKLSDSDTEVQGLKKELEAARENLETSKTLLEDKTKELEDMEKAKVADERMTELEVAKVARSNKELQLAKIKEMSTEDFTSYKDELVEVRKAVEVELEKAKQVTAAEAEAKAKEEAEAKAKADAKSEEGTEEDKAGKEEVAPVLVDPVQAAKAALNMEHLPTNDIVAKYAKMGEAMAKAFKKDIKE